MGGEISVTGATVVALAASGIIAISFRSEMLTGRASAHGGQCTEHLGISQTLEFLFQLNSSNNSLASCKSLVSNPSVNQL